MRVLQTIGGMGAKSGGPSACTYELLSALQAVTDGDTIDLLTPDVRNPADQLVGFREPWMKIVPNDYVTPIAFSRNINQFLADSDYDLYHSNGMWMHVNHSTCAVARKKGKPYIVTPHGMLYSTALARSRWKKMPFKYLWFNKDIREAACIHVTCQQELDEVRKFGYKRPIAVIGNPVEIPDYTKDMFGLRTQSNQHDLKIGFLGRLHPIKGIDRLLRGIALAGDSRVSLEIVGTGDEAYERFLRDEAKRLGIESRVHFLGFLNGFDKYAQLAQLDCLFVPSDMENFGMIVPEALVVGTPVMASLGTPWESLNTERCGWWRDNSPESIASVIGELSAMSPDEHRAMGQRGRDYILRTFTAEKIASEMLRLYRWLLGEADKPEFVYTV